MIYRAIVYSKKFKLIFIRYSWCNWEKYKFISAYEVMGYDDILIFKVYKYYGCQLNLHKRSGLTFK